MGGLVKGIGKAISGVVKGVAKFASSPIGSMLVGAGLSLFTGGGSLLMGGIKSIAGKLGSLGNIFGGVASKFLGNPSSMFSGAGLGTVTNFLQGSVASGQGSTGVANIFQSLTGAWQMNAQKQLVDNASQAVAYENSQQLAAYYQAQALRQRTTNQASFANQFSPTNFY